MFTEWLQALILHLCSVLWSASLCFYFSHSSWSRSLYYCTRTTKPSVWGAPLRHQNCQETDKAWGSRCALLRGGMFVLPFYSQLIVEVYFPRHMDGNAEYFTMRSSYALRIYLPDVRMEQLHISGLRCEKNLQMLFLFICSYILNMRLNAESFHKEY